MAELDDKVIVTKDKITDIADTIRETGGTSARMTLDEMPNNIRAIGEGGGNVDAPLFVCIYPNTVTCNLTFAKIEEIYAGTGDTKASMPQLIYKHSSSSDNGTRSVYCDVTQYDEDTFIFKFNMGYARGVGKTQWQERIIEIEYASGNQLRKIDDYIFEYQKPIVEGDGINITTEGLGNNRKSKISVDSSMIMIGNASGSVASIVDGADDLPMKSCIVAIEPVQSGSGDPSPSNVRPISGWTECNVTRARKNLFNPSLLLEASGWSVDTNGVYSGNAYNLSQLYHHNQGGFPIKFKENTQYTITFQGKCEGTSGTGLILFYLYSDGTASQQNITASENLQNYTFTSTAGKTVVELNCSYSSNLKTYIKNLMLAEGSSATDYESYQANTYNIEFPSEAGTVYGGTLDVTNGVLIVDSKCVTLEATDVPQGISGTYAGSIIYNVSSTKFANADFSKPIKSNMMKYISNFNDFAYGTCTNYNNISFNLWLKDGAFANQSEVATFLSENTVQVYFKLATPQTYNLTPTEVKTLLGINNIFADCGDVDVEYTRDATSIINWLIAHINLGA